MPIRLDRDPSGHPAWPGVECLRGKSPVEFREADARCLDIGLINNMPDAALEATERQFLGLLDAAADGLMVRLTFYALPDVPRTDSGRRHVSSFYSGLDDLWDRHLDGLIVTGTEPRAPDLRDEPYWGSLTSVLEWAEHTTHSTVWSCLAAHAALLHRDGIGRRTLRDKRFGVFECSRVSTHPLTDDRIDMFVKQLNSLFVFFQGHPEYEATTLLLEYRRDIKRFLRRERETYPPLPQGYFDDDTIAALTALRARALSDRREEQLEDFPTALVAGTVTNSWRPAAARIYRNWLLYLCAQKARGLKARNGRTEWTRVRTV